VSRETILRVEGLSKRFGSVQALREVSFECRRGEIFGLLGPNGAGKTTTVRAICSIITPDAGTIEVDGIRVGRDPIKALERIAVVLEDGGLYNRLTAEENMRLFAELHGVARHSIARRIDEVCRVLELEEYRGRKYKELSKGNRQKVLLGQALVIDPPLLILDEPTAGLDVPTQKAIRGLLKTIKKDRAVLYSTHIMSEAEELCDRLAIVDHGRVVAVGTLRELLRRARAKTLERAFLELVGTDV